MVEPRTSFGSENACLDRMCSSIDQTTATAPSQRAEPWRDCSLSCLTSLREAARLDPGQVHVWAIPLDVPETTLRPLARLLSPDEVHRASRFRLEQHRKRFAAGRGALRRILGACLEVSAETLKFSYGPNGKPAVASPPGAGGLEFNLSHSEDLALLAVTRGPSVGVDLERVRLLPDADDLVQRFFSRREAAVFQRLPPRERPAAFFNLWTRKEAFLKATGEGIAQSLHLVEVSFLPGEPAALRHLPRNLGMTEAWSLSDLSPGPGFVAALAIHSRTPRIRRRRAIMDH